jgi:hypothetical protein
MFDKIRYRIGTYYLKKAHEEISKDDFQAIMKGLKHLKKAISIVPPSKELTDFEKKMKSIVETHKSKLKKK